MKFFQKVPIQIILTPMIMAVTVLLSLTACCGNSQIETSPVREEAPRTLSNFAKLNKSVWRSEQPSAQAFQELEKMGLKSVLNLREYHSDDDEAKERNLHLYHFNLAAGKLTATQLEQCLMILKSAPKPVLIHCKHGSDRTGAVCAAYRIVFEQWTKEQAIRELTDGGYGFHGFWYPNIPKLILQTDFDAMRARVFPENTH